MRNWYELVNVAVSAEVPDFEIMTSLAVFLDDLTNDQLGDDVVKRVATFFKICPAPKLFLATFCCSSQPSKDSGSSIQPGGHSIMFRKLSDDDHLN